MGVEAGGGYLSDPSNKTKVKTVVDAAISAGLYVIIDWHSHEAEKYQQQSIDFFKEMAQTYGNSPNVIYEIYNEPLNTTSWSNTIKPYANAVIKAIRDIDPDNIIVVGTPTWSQDVDIAANDPITGYSNIAYTLHFYAATHKQNLRDKATIALNKGLALFVTEWGTCEASGDGFVDEASTKEWVSFMKANGISNCNWSINDKSESASMLKPGVNTTGNWSDSDLTASGKLVKDIVLNWGGAGDTQAPTTPTNLASPSKTSTSVNLTWTASTDNVEVTGYEVFVGSESTPRATVTTTSATIGSLSASTTYSFSVRAKDAAGNVSAKSTAISITTDAASTTHAIPGTVQAEAYSKMSGVQLESTTDDGGGQNVGWIDTGDWMDYSVDVATSGSYTVKFRVASAVGGGVLELRNSSGSVLGSVSIANTGGWQAWTTLSATVNLSAGTQTLRLYASTGGFNVNWVEYVSESTTSTKIEAENWEVMSGVKTESTSDAGGGLNVGWIDAGDWMAYNVNISTAGTYRITYRVASPNSSKTLKLEKDAGATLLGTVTVPNTGGWQAWTNVSHDVSLPAGSYHIAIATGTGGFNVNYFTISSSSPSAKLLAAPEVLNISDSSKLQIYPNPVSNHIFINSLEHLQGVQFKIINTQGKEILAGESSSNGIDVSQLKQGIYIIMINANGKNFFERFIKN